jgi:hypothetical protein
MQRGSLDKSLETTFEFESAIELAAHIEAKLPEIGKKIESLRVSPYGGDDPRCGWKNVHMVEAPGYGVIGFIEGELPNGFPNA